MGILFYKLLNIDIGYQPLNLFIQSEALFRIVLLVLEEHKEFSKGASVGNYLHRQGILDKIFPLYKGKNLSDSGVERSREPLKIYRASILAHANSWTREKFYVGSFSLHYYPGWPILSYFALFAWVPSSQRDHHSCPDSFL